MPIKDDFRNKQAPLLSFSCFDEYFPYLNLHRIAASARAGSYTTLEDAKIEYEPWFHQTGYLAKKACSKKIDYYRSAVGLEA